MDGFITLHRKIINWEWYTDVPTKVLFLHLLLTANYEEKQWKGQTIQRGQLITSINKLSKATGLTYKQVRLALDKLKRTHEVAVKGANKYSLITVEKYNDYQDKKEKKGTQQGTQQGNQRATTNNINNNNNIKKESKNIISFNNIIEGYTNNEELRQELKNHLMTRKAKKATLTNRAIELSLKTLDKLTEKYSNKDEMKLRIVRQSIERGWIGFFEIKQDKIIEQSKNTYNNYQQREVLDFSKFYANGNK